MIILNLADYLLRTPTNPNPKTNLTRPSTIASRIIQLLRQLELQAESGLARSARALVRRPFRPTEMSNAKDAIRSDRL